MALGTGLRDMAGPARVQWAPAWRQVVWGAPLVAGLGVYFARTQLQKLDVAVVAGLFVVWVYRRPKAFLLALPVVYPCQLFVLSYLYRAGLGTSTTRDLGYWVEAFALGVSAKALHIDLTRWRKGRVRSLDWVDWAALLYLLVAAIYWAAPTLLVHAGPVRPPTGRNILDTSLRNDTLFVVLFLAVRRLDFTAGERDRFALRTFWTGVGVGLIGLFEFARPAAWNHLVVKTFGVPAYELQVLHNRLSSQTSILVYTPSHGHRLLRVASIFIDQLQCAFFLLVAFTIGLEIVLRRRGRWRWAGGGTAVVVVALVLTQTRDALLAAAVAVLLAAAPLAGRVRAHRRQLLAISCVAAAVLAPLAFAVGLAGRTSGAIGGTDQSASLHLKALRTGAEAFLRQPMGRGLGTGAINGTRFGVTNALTSENQYLQIGNEIGVFALLAFIALTIGTVLFLERRAGDDGISAASWMGAIVALSVAGIFLQVWLAIIVAGIVWTGAAMQLPKSPAAPVDAQPAREAATATATITA
jgi:hypothetical protein